MSKLNPLKQSLPSIVLSIDEAVTIVSGIRITEATDPYRAVEKVVGRPSNGAEMAFLGREAQEIVQKAIPKPMLKAIEMADGDLSSLLEVAKRFDAVSVKIPDPKARDR